MNPAVGEIRAVNCNPGDKRDSPVAPHLFEQISPQVQIGPQTPAMARERAGWQGVQ